MKDKDISWDELEQFGCFTRKVKQNKITNKPKEEEKMTYLMFDGNLYKIGKSKNPENRLKQIKTGNPNCKLICYGYGIEEETLHKRFYKKRVRLEWFDLNEYDVKSCTELINGTVKYNKHYSEKILQAIHLNYEKNKNYVITFGKYKGRKIISMIEYDELNYCKWIYKQEENSLGVRAKNMSRKYKAFKWWVTDGIKNYNDYLETKESITIAESIRKHEKNYGTGDEYYNIERDF
jgi:hypothetical protein